MAGLRPLGEIVGLLVRKRACLEIDFKEALSKLQLQVDSAAFMECSWATLNRHGIWSTISAA